MPDYHPVLLAGRRGGSAPWAAAPVPAAMPAAVTGMSPSQSPAKSPNVINIRNHSHDTLRALNLLASLARTRPAVAPAGSTGQLNRAGHPPPTTVCY